MGKGKKKEPKARYGVRQLMQIGRRLGIRKEEKAVKKALGKVIPKISSKFGISLDPETISRAMEGALNYSFKIRDFSGKRYFLSIARRNPQIMKSIMQGYIAFGFDRRHFGYRSMREQHAFIERCKAKGIPVPNVVAHGLNYLVREFTEGEALNSYLASRKANAEGKKKTWEVVSKYINEIMEVHSKGIVFGDRDGTNTIVKKNGSIEFFDFDIKIWKEGSPEFEIAQAMYFTVVYSKNKQAAIKAVETAFRSSPLKNQYRLEKILEFLKKRGTYYRKHPTLGGVEKETMHLVEMLSRKH